MRGEHPTLPYSDQVMDILQKLRGRSATIGVVGLGYVGLPLMIGFAEKGIKVIGFDIDRSKTDSILKGESYIRHIDGGGLAAAVADGRIDATTDFGRAGDVDALILCVPTPLDDHFSPDLSYVV